MQILRLTTAHLIQCVDSNKITLDNDRAWSSERVISTNKNYNYSFLSDDKLCISIRTEVHDILKSLQICKKKM